MNKRPFLNSPCFFFVLTLLTGFLTLSPYNHFQSKISVGDSGRDLYCFEQTMSGKMPIRDYWWTYGCLMPYYYAGWYKIFSPSIQVTLWAQNLLIFGTGIMIFLSSSLFLPAFLSSLAAFFFWEFCPRFFHTYNHAGGVFLMSVLLFLFARHLSTLAPDMARHLNKKMEQGNNKSPRRDRGIGLFILSVLLLGAYPPFGMINALGTALFVYFFFNIGQSPLSRLTQSLLFLGATVAGGLLLHWPFIQGLAAEQLHQCFPFLKPQLDQFPNSPAYFWPALQNGFAALVTGAINRPAMGFVYLLAYLGGILIFLRRGRAAAKTPDTAAWIFSLGFLTLLFLIPFFSSGVLYRAFWTLPLLTLLLFAAVGYLYKECSQRGKILMGMLLICLFGIDLAGHHRAIASYTRPAHFIKHPKALIYTDNSAEWITTIEKGVHFLETQTTREERILALPYDLLYLFLAERTMPLYQHCFFEFNGISENQQEAMMAVLEKEQVRWILLSNRYRSAEVGLGTFGRTHGTLLASYLQKHFEPAATIGPWEESHAIKFLKRK